MTSPLQAWLRPNALVVGTTTQCYLEILNVSSTVYYQIRATLSLPPGLSTLNQTRIVIPELRPNKSWKYDVKIDTESVPTQQAALIDIAVRDDYRKLALVPISFDLQVNKKIAQTPEIRIEFIEPAVMKLELTVLTVGVVNSGQVELKNIWIIAEGPFSGLQPLSIPRLTPGQRLTLKFNVQPLGSGVAVLRLKILHQQNNCPVELAHVAKEIKVEAPQQRSGGDIIIVGGDILESGAVKVGGDAGVIRVNNAGTAKSEQPVSRFRPTSVSGDFLAEDSIKIGGDAGIVKVKESLQADRELSRRETEPMDYSDETSGLPKNPCGPEAAPPVDRLCPRCKRSIPSDAIFCTKCGNHL